MQEGKTSQIKNETTDASPDKSSGFRARIARLLGVEAEKKENLYLELSRGATLYDLVYWLQILFAAGIATLGLVMNSPAVIIGAMLISPLMGPILAAGLALASGDVILGLRSIAKLFLSCALAVAFAIVLVAILPFREMTDEIAARTQPNTLDLFIALFSGAVGSIAVCREVKGVATSIPGVAIAVALMPPLCVAGYGLGLILTFDAATGWRIASGGGLLFLTNLVAITFTAMVVFLTVKLSTAGVRKRAEQWEHEDPESAFILKLIGRFPRLEKAREIRSLPVRFVMILAPLVAILIPLSQAFNQLQGEIARQRRENITRAEVMGIWQERFQNKADGGSRSTIDQLTVLEKDNNLRIDLRLFDDEPYTADEKKQFAHLIASRLKRSVDSVNLRLTEIPTTLGLATLREREKKNEPQTVSEIQSQLWQQVDNALSEVELPPNAQLLNRQLVIDGTNNLQVKLVYLCDSNLDPAVQNSVIDKIRGNLKDKNTVVSLERVPIDAGFIEFSRGSASLPVLGMLQLDFAGRVLRENPDLILAVGRNPRKDENKTISDERVDAVTDYLATRWQIAPERVKYSDSAAPDGKTGITFQINGQPPATVTPVS
jgi:uncharacterized hydrophobic protein (TIGR00271 family)